MRFPTYYLCYTVAYNMVKKPIFTSQNPQENFTADGCPVHSRPTPPGTLLRSSAFFLRRVQIATRKKMWEVSENSTFSGFSTGRRHDYQEQIEDIAVLIQVNIFFTQAPAGIIVSLRYWAEYIHCMHYRSLSASTVDCVESTGSLENVALALVASYFGLGLVRNLATAHYSNVSRFSEKNMATCRMRKLGVFRWQLNSGRAVHCGQRIQADLSDFPSDRRSMDRRSSVADWCVTKMEDRWKYFWEEESST